MSEASADFSAYEQEMEPPSLSLLRESAASLWNDAVDPILGQFPGLRVACVDGEAIFLRKYSPTTYDALSIRLDPEGTWLVTMERQYTSSQDALSGQASSSLGTFYRRTEVQPLIAGAVPSVRMARSAQDTHGTFLPAPSDNATQEGLNEAHCATYLDAFSAIRGECSSQIRRPGMLRRGWLKLTHTLAS